MKRLLALIMVLSLLLAACAAKPGETESSTENTTAPTGESTAPTDESTEPTVESTEPTGESTEPGDGEETRDGWIERYNLENELVVKSLYENDVVMEEIHYENGKPFWRAVYTYGNNGEVSSYDSEILDENGTVLKKIHHVGGDIWDWLIEDGEERWCCTYVYDENGTVIDEVYEYPEEGETVQYRKFYAYDENGNLTGIFTADAGEDYDADYDAQGRVVFETQNYGPESDGTSYEYNEDGSYSTIYAGATSGLYYSRYTAQGCLVERYGDDDPGDDPNPAETGDWDTYEYNQYDDVISSEERCFGELSETYRYEYKYDDIGNWIQRKSYRDGELCGEDTRTFDQSGKLIEETDYEEGGRYTYTYDKEGRLSEKVFYGEEDYVQRISYRYDESGRLLEEVCTEPESDS